MFPLFLVCQREREKNTHKNLRDYLKTSKLQKGLSFYYSIRKKK
jgi:hypothetical protein